MKQYIFFKQVYQKTPINGYANFNLNLLTNRFKNGWRKVFLNVNT